MRALAALALVAACAPQVRWVHHLPDGRVQLVEDHEGWCVEVAAGVDSFRRCHEGLAIETLHARPEGIAYAARDGGRWRVFQAAERAFEARPADRSWLGTAEVQLDSSGTLAFVAEDGRGWWVVVGERAMGPWPEVFEGSLRLDPSGSHAFVATDRQGSARVVVDGRVSEPWDGIGHLRFTRGGRALYVARRADAAFVVLGDRRHGPYRSVTAMVERGRTAGWVAQRDDGWVAVVEGRASDPHPSVEGLTLGPGGFSEAFVVRAEDGARVVHDGVPGPLHAAVAAEQLRFVGADRLLRVTADDGRWSVRVGEEVWGGVHEVLEVAAGGGRWAAVVRPEPGDERVAIWVDGRERARARWVADLTIDRHGVAYLAGGAGGPRVVVDGVAYPFPMVLEGSLVLAGGGRHWGCVVMDEDGSRPRVIVDGVRSVALRLDELASRTLGRDPLEVVATGPAEVRAQVAEALASTP